MRLYRHFLVLTFILALLQTSCNTPEENVTVVPTLSILPTDESRIVAPTITPQVEIQTNHLVICMEQEPETLFWYARESIFQDAVLHGIFENDITSLSYDYQATGLERIPSYINGDAITRVVPVDEGDNVVDVNGDVIELEMGSRVVDADGEVSTYDGTTLLMNQMVVDFKMKQRAWSDGQPVTAADSVYSFHLAARPDTPGDKFLVDRTASYQATGNLQVRWTGLPGFINVCQVPTKK